MKKLLTFIFILACYNLTGQYYSSGNDPARLKWKQIKTPVVRLVFEESMQKRAEQLAAFMDSIAPQVISAHKISPRRIDLLLHNQSSYSNGFVTWAPRRSEFYTIPGQSNGSTEWLQHLGIHEYRHVVQISQLNQGFTRFLSFFTGQQASGAVLGIYLPLWFLEGDAVTTETTLSQSGRGRSFEFNSYVKAQLLEKGRYSYDKAYMGSYRDQVPNYYKMGYLFTGLARQKYGPELWENVLTNTGRNSLFVNPFNRSLRKQTGVNKKQLYNHLFGELQHDWQDENNHLVTTDYQPVKILDNDYISYEYLTAIDDSTVIAQLEGPGIRSQIAQINPATGSTQTLAYTGDREEEPISANQNMVIWSELQNHPRWENQIWSVIRTYNRQTQKTNTIHLHRHLQSPAIHPQQNIIAAVEAKTDYRFFITIIDAQSGQIIKEIPTPNNDYPFTPTWNSNGQNLICLLLTNKGKAIYSLNPNDEKWQEITAPDYDEKRYPIQKEDTIWYVAKGTVSDEIFKLNLSDSTTTCLTSSAFGASYPTILPNGNLVYSRYDSNGYRPVIYSGNAPAAATKNQSLIDRLAEDLSKQEPTVDVPENNITTNYKVQNYSKWHLFNLHSWAPAYIDFDRSELYSGLSVMSQNLLGTTIISAGYNSDPSKVQEKYNLNFSYLGWFPILDLILRKGDDQYELNGFYEIGSTTYNIDTDQQLDYLTLKAGVTIPLDLSRNIYYRYLSLSARYTLESRSSISFPMQEYLIIDDMAIPTNNFVTKTISAIDFQGMQYTLYFYNLRHGTTRDVTYRHGQAITLSYRDSPWGNYQNGSIAALISKIYLPGLFKYHAITMNNEFQHIENGDLAGESDGYDYYYRYSNMLSYPRGYTSIYSDDLYIFRGTYQMPLWNPDVAIGSLVYLKRLRLNIFYDQALGSYQLTQVDNQQDETFTISPASLGTELYADTHLFRFIMPFSIGFRTGYRTEDQQWFGEFIISNSLSSFLVNNKK
jgi:hypothetical protein